MCRVDEGKAPRRHSLLAGASAVALLSGMLAVETGQAAEYSFDNGTDIAFDTTVAVGLQIRVQDPDDKNVGIANGGTRFSINGDDGNLNYDAGLSALVGRVTHELSVDYSDDLFDFGLFGRVAYFYDIINRPESTDAFARTNRTRLGNNAVQRTGRNFEFFDAFIDVGTEIGDMPIDLRLGRQTLNWGESTFIPNGLNVITPFDVTALRSPGSEVRDALLPFGAVDLNVGIVDNLSIEGFVSLEFEDTELDPRGTLFNSNDGQLPDGEFLFTGFGNPAIPDAPETILALPGGLAGIGSLAALNGGTTVAGAGLGLVAERQEDQEPSATGDFGFALRYFAEDLIGGTELGLYYLNYASRTPVTNAVAGDLTESALFASLASAAVVAPNYLSTAGYFNDFRPGINLVGASFNTELPFGTALQGEVTYRWNQPVQLDDTELLVATLGPGSMVSGAASAAGVNCTSAATSGAFEGVCDATAAAVAASSEILTDIGADTAEELRALQGDVINGFREVDMFTFQMTATHTFDPIEFLGVDQWILIGEVGVNHIIDMPDLLLEGPGAVQPGTDAATTLANAAAAGSGFVIPKGSGFADQTSWGYRLAVRFDMLNAVGPINLFPRVAFAHDPGGSTPLPLGTFVENRASVSVGIEATYLERWSADLQYTEFFAIGDNSSVDINDRDFVSFALSYAF